MNARSGNLEALQDDAHSAAHTENADGWQPIHFACQHGHLEVVQWMVDEQHVSPVLMVRESLVWNTDRSEQPIHLACEAGHLNIVQCLVTKYGVAVDVPSKGPSHLSSCFQDDQNELGKPIDIACRQGHMEIVRWLVLEQGINANPSPGEQLPGEVCPA